MLFVGLILFFYAKAASAEFAGSRSISSRTDQGMNRFVCWNMVLGVINLINTITLISAGAGSACAGTIIIGLGNFYLYFQGRGA